jgi:hypothetical protein
MEEKKRRIALIIPCLVTIFGSRLTVYDPLIYYDESRRDRVHGFGRYSPYRLLIQCFKKVVYPVCGLVTQP